MSNTDILLTIEVILVVVVAVIMIILKIHQDHWDEERYQLGLSLLLTFFIILLVLGITTNIIL